MLALCCQANQVGHVVCGSCSITLMYAHGAQSVKCAVCNHVTPVAGGGGGAAAPLPAPAPGPAPQPMLAVNGGGQAAGGASSAAGGGGASAGGSAGGRGGSGTTVVVENPPSLDEHGNEVCGLRARLAHVYTCRSCIAGRAWKDAEPNSAADCMGLGKSRRCELLALMSCSGSQVPVSTRNTLGRRLIPPALARWQQSCTEYCLYFTRRDLSRQRLVLRCTEHPSTENLG